jgi:hypothetical protein
MSRNRRVVFVLIVQIATGVILIAVWIISNRSQQDRERFLSFKDQYCRIRVLRITGTEFHAVTGELRQY